MWIQRVAVFIVGSTATVTSILVPSLYGLFILAADIVFVIVFPQLICVVFLKFTNSYGSLTGYFVGLILRLGAGEFQLKLSPFWKYPFFSETDGQLFPFRTFSMLCSLITIVVVSLATRRFFTNAVLAEKYSVVKALCGSKCVCDPQSMNSTENNPCMESNHTDVERLPLAEKPM